MNETTTAIYLTELILSVILFLMILVLWSVIIRIKKQTEQFAEMKENNLEPVQMLVNLEKPCEKIVEMCDSFILEAVRDYLFLQGYDKEDYFNASDTKELEKYTTAYTKKFMSKSLRDAIGLFFNTTTDEAYNQFITMRIKIVLINIVAKNNVPIDGD